MKYKGLSWEEYDRLTEEKLLQIKGQYDSLVDLIYGKNFNQPIECIESMAESLEDLRDMLEAWEELDEQNIIDDYEKNNIIDDYEKNNIIDDYEK